MNSAIPRLRTVYDSERPETGHAGPGTARGTEIRGNAGPAPGATGAVKTADPHHEAREAGLMLARLKIDVFVTSEPLLATSQRVASDRRAVRSEFTIRRGGFSEATECYREHVSPDLVVIEDSGSADELEQRIETLADLCLPRTRLVIVGERNDIVLYRSLLKIGVSDYLVQPVTPLSMLDSIATIFMDDDTRELGLVVAFLGVRGGVGSSTVAHNSAALLSSRFDAATLLIDADIGFGTAALQFDISSPYGLADALKEREDLNGEVLERLIHWRDKRIGILTAPDRLDQMAMPEPGVMRHVIDQARRAANYVVLDLPHGWAPHTAEAIAAADRIVLVGTPDLPSLRNMRTLLGLVQRARPNDKPPQLVLNRMPVRGKPPVSREDFTKVLAQKIGTILPADSAAAPAEMNGYVLAEAVPDSDLVKAIETLITETVGRGKPVKGKKGSGSFLSRLFSRSK